MNETISDVWDDSQRIYPSIVYVETTNFCNANCVSCLNDRCKRTRGIMTLDSFKVIADKVKGRGLKIGAMFCFGEPLMDKTIEDKFEYAKSINVLTAHVGINTNVTFLTSDRFDKILRNFPNLILSFFNTGKEYERLTGGLNWEENYSKALAFIKYRDEHYPNFPIFISVNKIKGHNLENVKEAFSGCRVGYVQDAELRWGGKVITGVDDRMIMYNDWRCDGYKGALQIKYNGDCEFCAYDIIGDKDGGETKFANILTDTWEEINNKFKEKFRSGTSLCLRCVYWYNCKETISNGFKKVEKYEWQEPYLKGEPYDI